MASLKDPPTHPDRPIPKDAWRPCEPNIVSTPESRPPLLVAGSSTPATEAARALYRASIAQFSVATAARYRPRAGTTYCNIFVQDVAAAMGVPLPLKLANAMLADLRAGVVPRWRVATRYDVVQAAQEGHPALVGWTNPTGGPGHIVMVRPESSSAPEGVVCIAQAGAVCFQIGTLTQGFSSKRVPLVWAWAD